MKRIAVLMTCFNRIETTLVCLERLFAATLPADYQLEVFLVDDASPDETGRLVKERYPDIHMIQGTGDLYWCGGMRLAWDTAAQYADYDFFLWLNDDSHLYPDALKTILGDYEAAPKKCCMITGAFCDPQTKEITYRVASKTHGLLSPNGSIQPYHGVSSGNLVLISRKLFDKIGGLSKAFRHGCGDYEYAYRAGKEGYTTYLASCMCGECAANFGYDQKKLLNMSLLDRIAVFKRPNGMAVWDNIQYKRLTRGYCIAILSLCKNILFCCFPRCFVNH